MPPDEAKAVGYVQSSTCTYLMQAELQHQDISNPKYLFYIQNQGQLYKISPYTSDQKTTCRNHYRCSEIYRYQAFHHKKLNDKQNYRTYSEDKPLALSLTLQIVDYNACKNSNT